MLDVLEQCKNLQGRAIDFDDMIWLPVVRKLPQRKFDRVFVDETQDLNAAQIEMTLRACREGGRRKYERIARQEGGYHEAGLHEYNEEQQTVCPRAIAGENVTQVHVNMQDEVDELWTKLSNGGEEGQCGWLKDKYGLSWQIVPTILGELLGDKDAAKAQRVMEAMLKMNKIEINLLKQAYEQE